MEKHVEMAEVVEIGRVDKKFRKEKGKASVS